MTNASGRWMLAVILLLPGIITALSFRLLVPSEPDVNDVIHLPPTSAGIPPEAVVEKAPTVFTVADASLFSAGSLQGRLIIQSPNYRYRRSEIIESRVTVDISAGALPAEFDLFVWVTTRQGNFIADVTPRWDVNKDRIRGRLSVSAADGWPDTLTFQAVLHIPGHEASVVSLDAQLFEPVALVTGVDQPFLEDDLWQIPLRVTVEEPGVVMVTASLMSDGGDIVHHLHSRQRIESAGRLLMHLRRDGVADDLLASNLLLTDLQVRHISDRSSAPLGWGDSVQARYVLPVFPVMASGEDINN